MLAFRLGFPQPDEGAHVTLDTLEEFIDRELRSRLASSDYYHQTFQVKKVFGMNTSMYDNYNANVARPSTSSKKSRKCSECGKSGHTKSSCPKNKKSKSGRKKKTNYVQDNDSSSEPSFSSDSDSSDSDSDSHVCYGLKKKESSKGSN